MISKSSNFKFLIYDNCNLKLIENIIDLKKTKMLDFRKHENFFIKIFFLIPSLFKILLNIKLVKILFLEGLFIAYVCERIITHKPKFVLTTTDNDIRFYKLKQFFKDIKFVAIQNGYRSKFHDMFDDLDNKTYKNLSADYYCSFGNSIEKLIKKYINVEVIPVGSFKNNQIKIKNKKKKNNEILYISSYRNINLNVVFDKYSSGKKIFYKDVIDSEINLVKFMYDFCKNNNYCLSIAGCSLKNHNKEIKFYKKILPSGNWKFYKRKNLSSNYNLIDEFDVIANCCSTLGYEALGRNCKVAFFSREMSIYNDWRYGWPENIAKKGYFYSNLISKKEVYRILKNLIKANPSNWKAISIKETKKVMEYDYLNTKLKNLFKSIQL
tara:strand:+ start:1553 stop:2695 length:1143 start_codon:yes stop_codon:yes gene_type:complete